MKKVFFFILPVGIAFCGAAHAEDDFFGDLIMPEEIQQEQEGISGQFDAGKILDSKPKALRVERKKLRVEKVETEKAAPIVREPAPMGLKWLATVDEIEYLHVRLQPIEQKDMPNSYIATNLPNPVSAFREVLVSFGEDDALWRIAAYGKFIDDDGSATKGLKEYDKYYALLAKKYGNAHEFYTPAAVNVDKTVVNPDGTQSVKTSQQELPKGGEGFLAKLATGETTLYATFENGTVGVTLALLATGDNQTYIVVDYKNLTAGRKELEELYDAL